MSLGWLWSVLTFVQTSATVEESVEMGTGHALIAQFKQRCVCDIPLIIILDIKEFDFTRNAAIKRVVDAPLSVADKHS